MLGGFPLKVDAIPDENGFIQDGTGSQITNYSHASNNSRGSLENAGPASMATGISTINAPDQQTVNPQEIQVRNWNSTGVSIPPKSPKLLRHVGVSPPKPLNNDSLTAYNNLDATGFAHDKAPPVYADLNTVGPGCHNNKIPQSVLTPFLKGLSRMLTYLQRYHG